MSAVRIATFWTMKCSYQILTIAQLAHVSNNFTRFHPYLRAILSVNSRLAKTK